MRVDRERILGLLEDIEQQVDFMGKVTSTDTKRFLSQIEKVYGLRYAVIRSVEAMAGVCVHLMAKVFNKSLESYAECFQTLGEKGVIPLDLAFRLAAMARLRNLLVHRYWDVDDERVFSYCAEGIGDLKSFVGHVASFVGELE